MNDFLGARRRWWKKPPSDVPQIPWAKHVIVTNLTEDMATLELSWAHVDIYGPEFSIWLDSRKEIKSHMDLNKKLTKEFREFYEESGESFFDAMDQWVRGPRLPAAKKGVKEWSPRKDLETDVWTKGDHGSDNTYNWSGHKWWLGDNFEYYHFETDEEDEGVIVFWHLGGDPRGNYDDPEVWMGNFSEFLTSQEEHEPDSAETFLAWNENFENGILWAFNMFGMFEDPASFPNYILDAIQQDPGLLTPDMMAQIHENPFGWPNSVLRHVNIWETKKRRKLERGQKLLWRGLYPKE